MAVEDGGVSPDDIDGINDRIDGVDDSLSGLSDEVDGLGNDVSGLGDDVDGLRDDVDGLTGTAGDLSSRLDALEDPELTSCSTDNASNLCIPDGIDLATAGVGDVVDALCDIEANCCTQEELAFRFGGGIQTKDDCVDLFTDLVNNGFTPGFLGQTAGGAAGSVIRSVIGIAQAFNDQDVRVELDGDAVDACVDALRDYECPTVAIGDGDGDGDCSEDGPNPFCGVEADPDNPCQLDKLLNGLQESGERCGVIRVSGLYEVDSMVQDCGDGLVCRNTEGMGPGEGPGAAFGICLEPPVEGDRCLSDYDCMGGDDLFCNTRTNECQARGGVGDDCSYVDTTFEDGDLFVDEVDDNGAFDEYYAPSLPRQRIECQDDLFCDPDTKKCVARCTEGAFCASNEDCSEDTICNKTAFPEIFDRTEGFWGVCTAPIADEEPCTVRNDQGPSGPRWSLTRGWMGESECASGRCMDNPTTEGTDPTCAPAGGMGADCTESDTSGSSIVNWECDSGYCDVNDTCKPACTPVFEQDECDECPGEGDLVDYTCPEGHYCAEESYTNVKQRPVCKVTIANEQECDLVWGDNEDYYSGEGFDASCQSGDCYFGTCQTPKASGVACEFSSYDGSYDDTCDEGLFCDGEIVFEEGYYDQGGEGECAALLDEGDDCGNPYLDRCSDGLECVPVNFASVTLTAPDSSGTLTITADGNCEGPEYGYGGELYIDLIPQANAPLQVDSEGGYGLFIGLGTDGSSAPNAASNTVDLIAAEVNMNAGECFTATSSGTGSLGGGAQGTYNFEGTFECVAPPTSVGDTCVFGEVGEGVEFCLVGELDPDDQGIVTDEGLEYFVYEYATSGDPVARCGDSGKCEAASEAGEPCDAHWHCAAGLACKFETGVCVEKVGDGGNCNDGNDSNPEICLDEYDDDVCTDEATVNRDCIRVGEGEGAYECWQQGELPNDAICESDWECASDFCQYNPEGSDVCAARTADGEACDLCAISERDEDEEFDCDVEVDEHTEMCEEGSFCKQDVDSNQGSCTPQGGVGAVCEPRLDGYDCMMGGCDLWNGQDVFRCGTYGPVCGQYLGPI
jgi:hypothetical protein